MLKRSQRLRNIAAGFTPSTLPSADKAERHGKRERQRRGGKRLAPNPDEVEGHHPRHDDVCGGGSGARPNKAAIAPSSAYSTSIAASSRRRVAPSVFRITASYARARWPAAIAPASTRIAAIRATLDAARIATASWPIMLETASRTSFTLMLVIAG